MVTDLLNGLNAELEGVEGVDVVVAPPAMYLDLAERLIKEGGNKLILVHKHRYSQQWCVHR